MKPKNLLAPVTEEPKEVNKGVEGLSMNKVFYRTL